MWRCPAIAFILLLFSFSTLAEEIAHLRLKIEGMDAIISETSDKVKRDRLIVDRSSLRLKLIKQMRINSKSKEITSEERKEAQKILKNTKKTLSHAYSSSLFPKCHRIRGQVYIELGAPKLTVREFDKSLKLNPDQVAAPSLSLYIAEDYFEGSEFKQAIKYYLKFYKKSTNGQKALSNYKVAWSYVNLGVFRKAEKYFYRVIRLGESTDFYTSSFRDLAYVYTQHRNDQQIVKWVKKKFKGKERSQILANVLFTSQRQGKDFKETMEFFIKNQPKVGLAFEVLLAAVESADKNVFTEIQVERYWSLVKFFRERKVGKKRDQFNNIVSQVERLTEKMIRSFLEIPPSDENWTPVSIKKNLRRLEKFYFKYFPEAHLQKTVASLLIERCRVEENRPCELRLLDHLEKSVKDEGEQEKIAINRISIVRKRSQKNGDVKPLIQVLEDFLKKFDRSEKSSAIRPELITLYAKSNQMDMAYDLAQENFKKEKGADAFLILSQMMFANKKYQMLLELKVPKKISKKQLAQHDNLVREATLRLAQGNLGSGDFADYEKNIVKYIKKTESKDPKKADAARRDYFSRLIGNKKFKKLRQLLLNFPGRFGKDYEPIMAQIVERDLIKGNFNSILKLTSDGDHPGRSWSYEWFISKMATDKVDSSLLSQGVKLIKEGQKRYIFAILALTEPDLIAKYLQSKGKLSGKDKDLLWLTTWLKMADEVKPVEQRLAKTLGARVPSQYLNPPRFRSMALFSQLKIPEKSMSDDRYNQMTQILVAQTRKSRKIVIKDLGKSRVDWQGSILKMAIQVERQTRQAIIDSPTPKGLSLEEAKQYQEGISQLAQEFESQALSYEKSLKKANSIVNRQSQALKEVPSRFDTSSWVWPKKWKELKNGSVKKNINASLFLIDLQKKKKILTDKDYMLTRMGILLSNDDSQPMRQYVYNELSSQGMEELIQLWRKNAEEVKNE